MSSACHEVRMKACMLGCLLALAALAGCEREMRRFDTPPSAASITAATPVRHTELQPNDPQTAASAAPRLPTTPYRDENNAYAVSQGKRLYRWYNCSSCHAPGGGGDWGPALSDDVWIYGSSPQDIFRSIAEGRAAGMPSFAGHIPESEIWQLVAFVRSLSGRLRSDVASGRSDTMSGREPEAARDPEQPRPMEKPDGNVR
jgi:cytochrome c oxidase cbb3-type subunit 3